MNDYLSIINSFSNVLEKLTIHINSLTYKKTKIGLDIFIINLIGKKTLSKKQNIVIMKNIVEELNIPPSSATRKVNHLVSSGLIKRDTSDNNRREIRLVLTDEGIALFNSFRNLFASNITQILQKFSEEEKKSFKNILSLLESNSVLLSPKIH